MFRIHTNEDIVLQKIYQCIAEYHTDDNADELINDPAFKAVLKKGALASQPTLSRFNNRLDVDSIKVFEHINELLLDKIYKIKLPKQLLFDLNSTNAETY